MTGSNLQNIGSNFCIAPFIQITTHPSGSFSPCPYLGGTTWAPTYTSIIEAWQSSEIESLRQDFLSNQKNPICNRCWNEELHQKRSLRLRLFDPETHLSEYSLLQDQETKNKLLASINDQTYFDGPKIVSIKNGNICNAKCRSCHPGDSSRWVSDANKLHQQSGKTWYRINGREINWSDQQIDELFQLSQNILRLELFGGEPLYNKKVLALLNHLVSTGNSSNTDLYINTNGSVDILEKIPGINSFKSIDIGVSIDAVGNHFDYVRHGLNFATVINNVQKWQKYFDSHQANYTISSITTVSILNIFYLVEIKESINKLLGKDPFWNLLVDPDFLSIASMPGSIKKICADRLRHDASFTELVTLLDSERLPHAWQRFLEVTEHLDLIRKEKFADTFPEFNAVLQAHGYNSSDLQATDFNKVVIFIGDQPHPTGWYLSYAAFQYNPDCLPLTQDNCKDIVPGVYYTCVADFHDINELEKALTLADKIIYQEPKYWSDTSNTGSASKKIIEELLSTLPHKHIIFEKE